MRLSPKHAAVIGMVFWAGIVWLAVAAVRTSTSKNAAADSTGQTPAFDQLVDYAATRPEKFEVDLKGHSMRRGDPIFRQLPASAGWEQVGYVDRIDPEGSRGDVLWYQTEVASSDYQLVAYRNRGRFNDVLETLLPPEKRERIQQRITDTLSEHGEEITAAFRPVVENSLKESAPVLEDALKASVERHEAEFKELGSRWEQEILKDRMIPLFREEILPTVREHGEPVAKQIGRELWDRASIWRFGWRALYDRTPLPEKDLLKAEWERFVDNEAIPVFESHMDDIVNAQKQIFVDISENETLRDEVEAVFKEMAADKPFQDLMKTVVREAVIDNKELHQIWARNFKSDQAKAAIRLAGERFEPVVREIGDDLFGTREGGIDPDFARVLRNQILGKDKRWIVAVPLSQTATSASATTVGTPAIRTIQHGTGRVPFPLVIMAAQEGLNAKATAPNEANDL